MTRTYGTRTPSTNLSDLATNRDLGFAGRRYVAKTISRASRLKSLPSAIHSRAKRSTNPSSVGSSIENRDVSAGRGPSVHGVVANFIAHRTWPARSIVQNFTTIQPIPVSAPASILNGSVGVSAQWRIASPLSVRNEGDTYAVDTADQSPCTTRMRSSIRCKSSEITQS